MRERWLILILTYSCVSSFVFLKSWFSGKKKIKSFCATPRFSSDYRPSTVWMWFKQHGKHWERMKSYDVQIVLKSVTALSEPCAVAQCRATTAWLKRSLHCGHPRFWYDSEVLKVQCRFSSNTYIMRTEQSDRDGTFSYDPCCQEPARFAAAETLVWIFYAVCSWKKK